MAPRIAANVGNSARTAEALGAELHLVGPFGFRLDEKNLKRASVGYWETLQPRLYRDGKHFWTDFSKCLEKSESPQIFWATKGGKFVYTECKFSGDIWLIFGNEEEGVPEEFWSEKSQQFKALPEVVSCRIPMRDIRCLNLATSVGIMGYEVARQWEFQSINWTNK